MPSESGAAWSPPASNSERRLSNSSDGSAGSGYSKALSTDSADFLATRPHTAAVIPGKPAGNPLQFVRVGPADLGCRAREQLRKAELAKRTEPAKVEQQEDWQSNLDNWKSSRRKRVEHIIERCVEVRRLENEPSQPRGKSKTFNEMLEERSGRRRHGHLAVYNDDDGHDLSDLGIGTSSTKSSLSEDCDTHSLASDGMDLEKNHYDVDNLSNCDLATRKLGSSANEYDTCTTTTISSPEPEEYTYEGAIESYKSRIISQTNSTIVKTVVSNNNKETSPDKQINGDLNRIRTSVSNKIEEKLSSFQQERANDTKNNNQKKDLPKVDIHKRREQFERENSQESQTNKPKLPEIANKKSIKERMSSLEKFTEETQVQKSTGDLTKLPTEVKPLKERLSSLEKVRSISSESDKKRLSNGDLTSSKTLKERLSSFKTQVSEEEAKITKTEVRGVSMSLKERLSSLDAAKNKEIPKISVEQEHTNIQYDTKVTDDSKDILNDSSLKSGLSGLENQMQSFCRSLDSLDINGQSSPSSFDRVQSLEDFDCGDLQNNTIPSDIETEDSGVHTARDSCAPADDIADLTQVASPISEPMVEVSEYESSNEDCSSPMVPTRVHSTIVTKIENEQTRVEYNVQSTTEDMIIEEIEEHECSKAEDTDSASHYLQAVSQPEDITSTSEVTEINMDKDDEDTLKSLDNQDTSVSLNEPVSTASEGDTVVFEGKMTIHLDLNEICNKNGAGDYSNLKDNTNSKSMPMVTVSNITTTTNISPKNSIKSLNPLNDTLTNNVTCSFLSSEQNHDQSSNSVNTSISNITNDSSVLDALDLAFQELDSEDSSANESALETSKMDKKLDVELPKVENKIDVTPLYENVFFNNSETVDFPLELPTNVLEPPKEKPPPPPVEDGDDELLGNGNFKHTSSARRIKKEIRNKRSSFLGIEGQVEDYLDADLKAAPRPDITSFLQEETKIEKLLYKKTLSHDMDAKLRDSRDSGVDVDRGPSVEAWYKGSSPETSNPHSRQNSEPYTHVTLTSDEEEASKKTAERFTTNLTNKLENLDSDAHDQSKIENLDKKIQEQQACVLNRDMPDGLYDDVHTKEVLRFERELLQLEQEEIRRQRENLLKENNRLIQKSIQDVSVAGNNEKTLQRPTKSNNYRHSMPNLLANESYVPVERPMPVERTKIIKENIKRKPFVSEEQLQRHFGVEESRKVLYDDVKFAERRSTVHPVPRPPQPILPPKPKRDSMDREITMRSSRVPSAVEYANVDRTPVQLRQKPPANGQTNGQYQSMSRHTLQALSAAPTPKLISNSDWMQNRNRKPTNYNYNQHWLIQEAEQRRIDEQRLKMRAQQRHSYHQDIGALQRMHQLSNSHQHLPPRAPSPSREDKVLSVSGKRKCNHCGEELGRGAAMIIESLSLCYHVWCFTCAVCGAALGDGRAGADVRVRGERLHCHHCYSGDDGRKYSAV